MKRIQHFYMREKIHISSASDHIFVDSKINEVIFEGAQIRSTDLSFVGMNAEQVFFITCRIHSQKRLYMRRMAVQAVGSFQVRNCSINRLVISIFYNFSSVLFEDSKIGQISTLVQSSSNLAAFDIGKINFQRCFINQWHSYVFNSARNIGLVLLQNSRVKSIDDEAFANNFFVNVELNDVEVLSLGVGAFRNTNIFGNFIIQNTNIHLMQERVFAHMNLKQLTISQSSFGEFPSGIFEDTNCSSLNIHESKFVDYFNPLIFTKLRITRQLSVSNSQFMCSPFGCEENSLLLHSSIHNLAWKFSNNHCLVDQPKDTEKICADEVQTHNASGLVCRRRGGSIEECICVDNEPINGVQLPETTATILVLGDCSKVLVDGIRPKQSIEKTNNSTIHNARPNLQFLYLYRINFLEIVSVEKSLKQLHLLYSNIYFNQAKAFESMQLDELVISGSTINHVAKNSFSATHIGLLSVNGTTINHVDANAFTKSHIGLVELLGSKIVSAGNVFNFADRLRIEDTQLSERQHINLDQSSISLCSMNNLTKLASCKCANNSTNASCNSAASGVNSTTNCANRYYNNYFSTSKDCYSSFELLNKCKSRFRDAIFTAYSAIIALTISARFFF